MAGKIFINYRREDDAGFTQALYQRLELEFSSDDLFMDVEGHIKAGDDFVEVLNSKVAACDILLVVIGARWSEIMTKRASDPNDFVAIEIAAALDRGKRVIPVLVGGAAMPRVETLPNRIQALARRNAVGLRPERFKADCQGIITALREILTEVDQERNAITVQQRATAEAERRRREVDEAARIAATEAMGQAQAVKGLSPEEIRKAEELANWDFIKERGDQQAVRDHLARFLGGVTSLYAQAKLESLLWSALGSDADVATLRSFLDEFPKGAHAKAAREQIAILEKAAAQEEAEVDQLALETAEWSAIAANTDRSSIESFLARWPEGQHSESARARLRELKRSGFNRRALTGMVALTSVGGLAYLSAVPGMPIWRLLFDRSVRSFPTNSRGINSIAVSSDGKTLISGGSFGAVKVWELATGREQRTLPSHGWKVFSVVVTPDSQKVISANGTIKVSELASGRELRTRADDVYAAVVTPDGQRIISGSNSFAYEKTIKLWDLSSGRDLRAFSTESVRSLAVTPDGQKVVSGSFEKTIKLWDLTSGRELRTFLGHTGEVYSVAVTSDGQKLISGSEDKTVRIWEVATGRALRTLAGHTGAVRTVAVSRGGERVVSGSEDLTIKIWDFASGRELRTFKGHSGGVSSVAITPDGRHVISGSWDDTVRLWNLVDL